MLSCWMVYYWDIWSVMRRVEQGEFAVDFHWMFGIVLLMWKSTLQSIQGLKAQNSWVLVRMLQVLSASKQNTYHKLNTEEDENTFIWTLSLFWLKIFYFLIWDCAWRIREYHCVCIQLIELLLGEHTSELWVEEIEIHLFDRLLLISL